MTNPNRTEVVCLLDRSGSMNSIWSDAIGGLKTFIEDQKKDNDDTRITFVAFDTEYLEVVSSVSVHEFDFKVLETVRPRGGTALYDALGRSINSIGESLASLDEDERPANVIFCILTDGYENASREFAADNIKELIEHQTDKYNWVFTYLGANQDAFDVGSTIGIRKGLCGNIETSSRGIGASYSARSSMVRECKTSGASRFLSNVDDHYTQEAVDKEMDKTE